VSAVVKLFVASRPVSWVNTAFPFGAAYFFSTGKIDWILLLGSFFFLIPYNLLMYGVNDVFDYESDLRNPRKGGIEGALLDPKYHRITLILAFGIAAPFAVVLSLVNPNATFWLWLTLFAVVAYSLKGLRFKEIPFLDSLTSSLHFVGPMLVGLAMAQAQIQSAHLIAIAAFLIWGMASHAFGAVQDVRADREAKIASIATALGARLTTRIAFGFYVIAGLLTLTLPDRFAFAALAALPYLFVVGREFNITDENCEQANRGWKVFIWLNFFAGAVICSLLIGPSP
jgi:lycopene elongase/hydratase (flavuxanthin-forming)